MRHRVTDDAANAEWRLRGCQARGHRFHQSHWRHVRLMLSRYHQMALSLDAGYLALTPQPKANQLKEANLPKLLPPVQSGHQSLPPIVVMQTSH